MSNFLYCTADVIGAPTGGGKVTFHESQAMRALGDVTAWGRNELVESSDPWVCDDLASIKEDFFVTRPKLAHFYAGCFTRTVDRLRKNGCKVSYTAAAHNVDLSRREHRRLGMGFDYPHLNDPALWKRYVQGYIDADMVISPSNHSADLMRGYGCQNVVVIPHGVDFPEKLTPLPNRFAIGYMGAVGPDKGLMYLLQAWKRLGYQDGTLILAGSGMTTPLAAELIKVFGGGNIINLGWIKDLNDFYRMVTVYCQPSVTEGFGIEVLEALAHGRLAMVSRGCGAADVVPESCRFNAADVDDLADLIDHSRRCWTFGPPEDNQDHVKEYSWDKIRERYVTLWRGLLS